MPRKLPAEQRLALHRANQEWHFKKRVRQRFGLTLSDRDVEHILWRIREDKPGVVFLAVGDDGRSAWRVKWRKVCMVVIFDHKTERLVTALPFKRWKWE